MARILADENIPRVAVNRLCDAGHDVEWIAGDRASMLDEQICEMAVRERRAILTFDKDFGLLARQSAALAQSGIVLCRFDMHDPDRVASIIVSALGSLPSLEGKFVVVSEDRIRVRQIN